MPVLFRSLIILFGLTVLSACSGSGVGQVLGLDKEAPDEFTVVTRAPLTLPPDFGLRPPDPRNQRIEDEKVKNTAEAALFGVTSNKQKRVALNDAKKKYDGAELAMLQQAEAIGASSDIRAVIDSESDALALAADSFMDDFLFWKDDPGPGIIVDADSENARLSENAGLGKSVSEGDTPMIRRESEASKFEWPF